MSTYNPKSIEPKWQKYWEKNKTFQTPTDTNSKNKMYILPQLPYPSGSGLHVGHAEVYTACDIYARYQRLAGKKVMQVIGWDSFGLPAENYAIKTNVHPKKSTNDAIDNFRKQIKELGISVDWDREVASHHSDYYKWTQWFFLLFLKRGLAYRKKQAVNWCSSCKTVLANEQVLSSGQCERCDTIVEQKEMEQWYLKITDYADRLIEDLDKVDWPEETKKRQRDWIGKSVGAEVDFEIVESTQKLSVFTTRPDTLFGATYMVLAPEHNLVQELKNKITNFEEVEKYIEVTKLKTDLDRQIQKEKTGVELKGLKAINPVNKKEIPIFISDYVLATYGTGAIMAVPAHDERDFEFAKKFNLEILEVVELSSKLEQNNLSSRLEQSGMERSSSPGISINSDFLNGLETKEATKKIIEWLEKEEKGKRKIQYKLRDWSVSRQRFWGAPTPVLYDDKGELHPVPEEDLPVLLPDDVDFKPTGESPLNYSKEFNAGVEEKYGKGWRREPDTLDTFMCSSWYFFRYLDPKNDGAFASAESLKKWMPVDFYLGGPEHVNGHLLYSRFFTKVLFDAGLIDFDEPFLKTRHQGLILGPDNRKMSKRWGNVVNPSDVVDEYGADTCRMYEMFMGPLENDKPWDTNGIRGIHNFLKKVFDYFDFAISTKLDLSTMLRFGRDDKSLVMPTEDASVISTKLGSSSPRSIVIPTAVEGSSSPKKIPDIQKALHKTIKKVTEDIESLRFNTAISAMMELFNILRKEQIVDGESSGYVYLDKADLEKIVLLLSPYAPHLSEELWNKLGNRESLIKASWPKFDEKYLVEDKITVVVQINGKVRTSMVVAIDITEEDIKKMAEEDEVVKKWIEGKEIKKIIYVTGRLVSIVV